MATVSLRHIQKIYPSAHKLSYLQQSNSSKEMKKSSEGGSIAVEDFNLEIKDKEFIVLVGPSGCGKSTVLRMIAGLEEITSGELYIDNTLVNDIQPKDRDISMVFQNYALYPHMSVRKNLEYPLKLKKMPKEEIQAIVENTAKILDIESYLERKPIALSGGQRQRVSIGRAIVRNPKIILMDEPLSNLDAKLRNQMRSEIIKLRERVNATFVYVTHDQTEAMTLGDRIVIMKDGEVQQVGSPEEVYDHPVNLFVAGFIGTPQMNFHKGELICEGDKYTIKLHDLSIPLDTKRNELFAQKNIQSQPLIIGIRPEHLSMTQSRDYKIDATANVTELMGSSLHVHYKLAEENGVAVVPTEEMEEGASYQQGERYPFYFQSEALHLFNEEGNNIEYL